MRSWLKRLVTASPLPEAIRERIYGEQVVVFATMVCLMCCVGTTTVLLLGADLLVTGDIAGPLPVLVCVLVCYAALLLRMRGILRQTSRQGSHASAIRDVLIWFFVLGLSWGMVFIRVMLVADNPQRCLLYALIVACLSSIARVGPVNVAFSFLVPASAGGLVAVLVSPAWFDPFALGLLLFYVALLTVFVLTLNNGVIERAVSAIQLEEQNEVVKLLLRDFEESASDWLWETDENLELRRVSPRLAEVAGKTPAELAGRFPHVLLGLPPGDVAPKSGAKPPPAVATLNTLLAQHSAFRDLVIPVVVAGEERSWSLTGKPILDKAGRFIGYHGVGSDITTARRSQEQIAFLARHDSLTQLPNRLLFNEVMHQACARCDVHGMALLSLDLDDFKLVNDSLGHATGDGVLVAVAERIRGCIRDGDTAARLGGDEFAIIVASADTEEIAQVARRLVERIERPYHFDGRQVEIGLSIGISLGPKDGNTPGRLMKNADLALYRAKADGRGMWRFYDSEMDEKLQDRRTLQSDLRQALVRAEFSVEFQPIIDLATSRIIAAEALLRWHHPTRGPLPPALFIPLAEEAGLIAPIGAWVLSQACLAAAHWPAYMRVAVNLSPMQFRDTGILEIIDGVLKSSGLEPGRLELEITENTVLETNTFTVDTLWRLHERGVRIALDDFGTGYSSLSYLRRFPFDKIKIDRSFIKDLGREKDDSSIILAIIGLADSMNMVVTAEGVETAEQAALLTSYGCAQAQGFLFAHPMTAPDLAHLIDASEALPNAAQ